MAAGLLKLLAALRHVRAVEIKHCAPQQIAPMMHALQGAALQSLTVPSLWLAHVNRNSRVPDAPKSCQQWQAASCQNRNCHHMPEEVQSTLIPSKAGRPLDGHPLISRLEKLSQLNYLSLKCGWEYTHQRKLAWGQYWDFCRQLQKVCSLRSLQLDLPLCGLFGRDKTHGTEVSAALSRLTNLTELHLSCPVVEALSDDQLRKAVTSLTGLVSLTLLFRQYENYPASPERQPGCVAALLPAMTGLTALRDLTLRFALWYRVMFRNTEVAAALAGMSLTRLALPWTAPSFLRDWQDAEDVDVLDANLAQMATLRVFHFACARDVDVAELQQRALQRNLVCKRMTDF